jgi:predicted AlkP superfamily phosphohydrolase/phosphomutase
LAAVVVLAVAPSAEAYIGPGAGFAVLSSFFVVLAASLSAFAALLTWPVRWTFRALRGRRAMARARVKRCVILGLDGMDPDLVDSFFAKGMLPNLQKLGRKGCYNRLGTTAPPLSPVAWSTFLTGSNPGKHNIFDFLTYDRRTYLPQLSSVRIGEPRRHLKIGGYRLPIGRPEIRMLRKSKPFWKILGEHGVFSSVIRVPITFPPEKFHGVLLSAMCVPDLRGSQGTFSYYTTRGSGESLEVEQMVEHTGGEQIRVERRGDRIESHLVGPPNTIAGGGEPATARFTVTFNGSNGSAQLRVDGRTVRLDVGQYSDWIAVTFRLGLGVKVSGICRFLLTATEPEFGLYVTPIQIDPERPAMPIAHPTAYSIYLSKRQGRFATLGLAEDTWALNEKILEDDSFLQQCIDADAEREEMFLDSLDKVKRGLCAAVFDGTDRIQHMFWRYIDPDHPARDGFGTHQERTAIEDHYRRCDELVGKVLAKCDNKDTWVLVISDHGFKPFRRGIDLNRWLIDNEYMALKPDADGSKYLTDVDWSRTRAFAIGLAGIYLNVKGREAQGIVKAGEEEAELRRELCSKLTGLRDDERNELAISQALNSHKVYNGPYRPEGPDVIVGYNVGYRVSWDAAVGRVTGSVFSDNTKAWSGDHCIDPELVPGVMFSNRRINAEEPRLMDIGPTVLDMFGVPVPKQMDGRPFMVAGGRRETSKGKATAR